jgi:AcrR family transcriptional regulator
VADRAAPPHPADPAVGPDSDAPTRALPGRRGQAARNDAVILEAARAVFLADAKAPIAAVADRAGVGISALYRRYPSKEHLLRQLCHDGLRTYIAQAQAAQLQPDAWQTFTAFLGGLVDADVHSLTVHLAGTFTPTEEMGRDALRANELAGQIVEAAHAHGMLRKDFVAGDVSQILEACAALRVPDPARTRVLRRRHLALVFDGLTTAGEELPGPPPTYEEQTWRWRRPAG